MLSKYVGSYGERKAFLTTLQIEPSSQAREDILSIQARKKPFTYRRKDPRLNGLGNKQRKCLSRFEFFEIASVLMKERMRR